MRRAPTAWPLLGQAALASILIHAGGCYLVSQWAEQREGRADGIRGKSGIVLAKLVQTGIAPTSSHPRAFAPPVLPIPSLPTVTPVDARDRVRAAPPLSATSAQALVPAEASAPAPTPAAASPSSANAFGDYLPVSQIDIAPIPVSALDRHALEGMVVPQTQVKLRIFVSEEGRIQNVLIKVADEDQIFYEPVRKMFFNTAFIPGRLQRRNVPVYMDIEINIADVLEAK